MFIDRRAIQFLRTREQVLRSISQIAFFKALDDSVLHQIFFSVFQIVPHDKTTKRKDSEEGHADDLEARHAGNQPCDIFVDL